jgi:hypothetical protein
MFFASRRPCRPGLLQPSPGEAALARAVTTLLKGGDADFYAGCGTFTFALALG